MDFTLKVWRQEGPKAKGRFETYKVTNISPDCSFLEMLDILNESLVAQGVEPVCFDHDCREGIRDLRYVQPLYQRASARA